MISSNENIGDRPIRKHFNGIVFGVLAFMAAVIVGAVLLFYFKPAMLSHHRRPPTAPATTVRPQ